MDYLSVSQYAKKDDTSERTVRNYCALGIIEGAHELSLIVMNLWSLHGNSC